MMILRTYFGRQLFGLFLSVFFFITTVISTQFLFEIFHDLNFYYVSLGDVAFFYLKELGIAGPIVLNVSFLMAWVLMQNRTAMEQQQHASLLSGWRRSDDWRFALECLCSLSLVNFLLLFYINPMMNLPLIQKTSSEVEWLSQKSIDRRVELKVGPEQILIIEGTENGSVLSPMLVQASDKGWSTISAQKGVLNADKIDLGQGVVRLYHDSQPPKEMTFESLSLPFSLPPAKVEWAGIDGKSLWQTPHPRGHGELFWRFFQVFQAWVCVLPFYSQKVALRQKTAMTNSLLEAGLLFGVTTILGFSLSKMIITQSWGQVFATGLAFSVVVLYGLIRAWQRGSYAYD